MSQEQRAKDLNQEYNIIVSEQTVIYTIFNKKTQINVNRISHEQSLHF